jgi:5,5'-dehydrodivanillate O-demethylase oxygenase subunit
VLTAARNDMLTRVGAATPMGNLLRRYWMPVAGASEFTADKPIKPVRLLGEDLTLFKDLGGRFGLIARHCAHRGADLSCGTVEDTGLRCFYHGWKFDQHGQCIEQPYEEVANPNPKARDGCGIAAYPVRELAGLLWAYLGPAPAPELPVWEPFTFENGFREIVLAAVPCNWFQCQENSIDPVHFEWMHNNWSARLRGQEAFAARHLMLRFDEFEYGFVYRRIREGQAEADPNWSVGRVALWPNGFYLGMHFEWRVPVDDENTLSISWFFMRVPKGREPYVQDEIPTWVSPIHDQHGNFIVSHVINQDIVGWVGQGRIADRSRENLRSSDIGIVAMRKRFFDDLEKAAAGKDPSGILRDPAAARCVALPDVMRKYNVEGVALADYDKHPLLKERLAGFRHHFGQPVEVRRAFALAMGIAG